MSNRAARLLMRVSKGFLNNLLCIMLLGYMPVVASASLNEDPRSNVRPMLLPIGAMKMRHQAAIIKERQVFAQLEATQIRARLIEELKNEHRRTNQEYVKLLNTLKRGEGAVEVPMKARDYKPLPINHLHTSVKSFSRRTSRWVYQMDPSENKSEEKKQIVFQLLRNTGSSPPDSSGTQQESFLSSRTASKKGFDETPAEVPDSSNERQQSIAAAVEVENKVSLRPDIKVTHKPSTQNSDFKRKKSSTKRKPLELKKKKKEPVRNKKRMHYKTTGQKKRRKTDHIAENRKEIIELIKEGKRYIGWAAADKYLSALEKATALRDNNLICQALYEMGNSGKKAWYDGKFYYQVNWYLEARKRLGKNGDRSLRAQICIALGNMGYRDDNHPTDGDWHLEALKILGKGGDPALKALAKKGHTDKAHRLKKNSSRQNMTSTGAGSDPFYNFVF